VFYDRNEVDYAEGPLLQDEDGRWHKDFYKVITDLEVLYDWQSTLVSLKDSFWAFQRDILLTHHYHRTSSAVTGTPGDVRLVGQLSFAHDGPLLEALNMALNPTETHYIDRSLSSTGTSTIIITPGTGYYRVSKQLLRLTTTRMLDQGFGVDLVSLAKPPLHRTPVFCFRGIEPELFRVDKLGRYGSRALDPLWGGDDGPGDCVGREKRTFWWEPFWVGISFWDRQMDLPLREDRYRSQLPSSDNNPLIKASQIRRTCKDA
jgi:DEP domain-containing protein 5